MIVLNKYDYLDRKSVRKKYRDAYRIAGIDGGWIVFRTAASYQIWLDQQ